MSKKINIYPKIEKPLWLKVGATCECNGEGMDIFTVDEIDDKNCRAALLNSRGYDHGWESWGKLTFKRKPKLNYLKPTFKSFVVKLPVRIEVDDYHDFAYIQDHLRQLIPGVKVEEVACAPANYLDRGCCVYHGVVYLGPKTNVAVKSLIKKIKKEEKDFERDQYE